jgi:carboxyl-terminal processing protease
VDEPGAPSARVREADLVKHLGNDKDKAAVPAEKAKPEPTDKPRTSTEEDRKPIELGGPDDFQLKQAMNHLKGLPVVAKADKPEETAQKN